MDTVRGEAAGRTVGIGRTIPRLSLTPEEAAESTGFSRTRIFAAIRDQELMARKSGKSTVIETDELARWVSSLPWRGRSPEAEAAAR
jgi:excisionase family DNA binding protein